MNILLTSSGRRTYLVDYFKQALGGEGLVFAANSQMSPALLRADGYVITPLIYEEGYIPFLLEYCRSHHIDLVISLFDIDLPVLAAAKEAFRKEGITVAVSDPEVIACCNDKYRMAETLKQLGIGCPETRIFREGMSFPEAGAPVWPVILKPRFGMGSLGLEEAADERELQVLGSRCRREIRASYLRYEAGQCPGEEVILQEKLTGSEYGLDIINDFSGQYLTTIVKKKIAMRAGETDEAVTLGPGDPSYEALLALGRRIGESLGHIGNMDVDVIVSETDGQPRVIDMNARFGGGYPFSHAAGVDLPAAYVAWTRGETVPPEKLAARPHVHAYKEISIQVSDGCSETGTEK